MEIAELLMLKGHQLVIDLRAIKLPAFKMKELGHLSKGKD